MNGSNSQKQSILNLPLAPSLPEFLNPDPAVPTVDSLFSLSSYSSEEASPENSDPSKPDAYKPRPSVLRRSRQVKAHFSYTTPLPLSFPYAVDPAKIKPRKVTGEAVGDGTAVKDGAPQQARAEASKSTPGPSNSKNSLDIEDFLGSVEPDWQDPVAAASTGAKTAYSSETRRAVVGEPQLAGVSQTFLSQILPNLDVGDAIEYLQSGKEGSESEVEKRKELASFLAGHVVRAEKPRSDREKGFAPWSLCYGGHQFGSWASQLGDGRAISVLTTPANWPAYHEGTYYPPVAELQLKGAGRTPYSRFADGLAVLRSSVREYLGSEAMAALEIPTSRALSLIHLPDVHVQRERMETGAVVCRVAPSWLRIGSFELPWSRDDWEGLRKLVGYAGKEVFGFRKDEAQKGDEPQDKSLAAKVLRETSRRNARTFAAWQSVGFMHGVLNTDNINISGLTIDYGPYAWMDVYSANHICNHSDSEGRYSYRNQPPIGAEAVQRMGAALRELIGCELEMAEKASDGKVAIAQEGWGSDVSKHASWTEKAAIVVEDISSEFMAVFIAEYRKLMGARLGISDPQQADFSNLVNPLLDLMSQHHLDFSHTFRLLSQFTSVDSPHIDRFLDMICPKSSVPEYIRESAHGEWKEWLQKYQARLEESEKAAGLDNTTRRRRMQAANPRFILRQWVLEEAISRLEKDNDVLFLQRVLDMATKPFEEYGEDLVDPAACTKPTAEIEEQRRLCGVGDDSMLGFQCSCSS